MRVKIVVIGRLRSRPERVIFDDYRSRLTSWAKVWGQSLEIIELDDRKTIKKAGKADPILRALSNDIYVLMKEEINWTLPNFQSLLPNCVTLVT